MSDKLSRPYVSSRFVLELDDGNCVGTLQNIEGGAFKSEVVEEKVGREGLASRYPGRPKYEDVSVQVGMSMAPKFWKWIKASFNYEAERKTGSLVALDYDNRERWRRDFEGALISEVGFPSLDGAAKEPAYLTVKFAVERLKEVKTKRDKYPAEQQSNNEWTKQILWLPSMFTFKIDDFNQEKMINNAKIDAFSVKQSVIDCPVGGFLETTKEPGRVEFPKLAVTVLQHDAHEWMDWYRGMVVQGNHAAKQEKTGHITFLSRDKKPLLTLHLQGIGITGVSPVKHDTKQEQMQKLKIDLYCESIDIEPAKEGTV